MSLGSECTQFDIIQQLDLIDENFKRLKMAVGLDI